MTETIDSHDGTKIAFDRVGDGVPVVIVGGALMDRSSPMQTVRLLAERFMVVSYDRRGRGDSGDAAGVGVERELEDLEAVIRAVGGHAGVFGMSSGAFIALQVAARGDLVDALAVYEPPYLTGHGGSQLSSSVYAERLGAAIADGRPEVAVELFLRQVSGGWFDEQITRTPWWPAMVALGPSLRHDAALTGDGEVPFDVLATISTPTLALYGEQSDDWGRASADAVSSTVPGGRMVGIAGQNHRVDEQVLAPYLLEFFGEMP